MSEKESTGLRHPVLIITYNRAETFSQLLSTLLRQGDREIFVFCDGPRNKTDKAQQEKILSQARKYESVSVKKSTKNLGCKDAVEAGIDWVLSENEAVIVLEDDLLPHADFLRFCDRNLFDFRDDFRVQQISGSNRLGNLARLLRGSRAVFSPVPDVWGWATWRSRWQRYREAEALSYGLLLEQVPERWAAYGLQKRWNEIFWGARECFEGRMDSWDYQWAAWGIVNELATVLPPANLVENHGFGAGATHTGKGRFVHMRAMPQRLGEPKFERLDLLYEKIANTLDTVWWIRHHPKEIVIRKLGKILRPHDLQ